MKSLFIFILLLIKLVLTFIVFRMLLLKGILFMKSILKRSLCKEISGTHLAQTQTEIPPKDFDILC